ncbi:LamG domain-containing protein [Verrucomicrobiaceae bacterium 227]
MAASILAGASAASMVCAQDLPATLEDQLIHYSSMDNEDVGAGSGADTSADAVFPVGAAIGVAGTAGGSAQTTPVTTVDAHLTSGASGQFFQALSFPGLENAGVQFGGIPSPGLHDFSVSLWFNFQGGAQNGILAGSGNPSSASEGWTIFLENGALIFRMSVGGGGSDLRAAVNGPVANDSEWHHAVLLIDQTAGVIRGFVDGSEVTGVGMGGPPDGSFVPDGDGVANSEPVLLGTRSSGGFQFKGEMDDFAVWERALTPAEISGIYDAGVAGHPIVAKSDSDGDGMPDVYEEQFAFLNPNDASDAALDEDLDTLTNLKEFELGTNPGKADTDDDGLDDQEEIITNPLVADSDGDGLDDGSEVNTHMTDPSDADSDDDNLSDGAEIHEHMTDPNKADSDNDTFNDDVEIASGTLPNDDQSFPVVAVQDDLFVYYNFDEDSLVGETITDQAGNVAGPFDGTKTASGPTSTTGIFGEAAGFGGVSDAIDLSAHAATLGALTEGTISAWVQIPNEELLTDVLTIFAISDDLDASSEARFWVSNGGVFGTGSLAYGVRNDGIIGGTSFSGTSGPLLDGGWHHVVTTFRADSGIATLYLDGQVVGSNFSVFFSGVDGANSASIGRNRDSGGEQWFYDGAIDDFAIWTRALNPVEVSHIYSEGLAGVPLAPGFAKGLAISSIDYDPGNQQVVLTWGSKAGVTYEIEASTDLVSWEVIDDVTATGSETSLTDAFYNRGELKAYYRVNLAK